MLSRRISAASIAATSTTDSGRGRLEWIRDPQRFLALEADWDELAALHRTPFLRHSWIRSWWQAFGAGRELAIIALWEGDELAAVFPRAAHRNDLEGLAGSLAPDFRPFGRSRDAVAAVVDAALGVRPSRVSLYAVPVEDAAVEALEAGARRRRFIVDRHRKQTSPYVECHGGFENYLTGVSRDVRAVRTRRRRALEADHRVTWTVWTTAPELPDELDEALALESSGWKRGHPGAVLSSPEMTAFYHEFARAFAAEGRFALAKLQVDGRLAAVVIGLVDFNRFWLLRTAFDQSLSKYSPGMMLALAITERCFEQGLEAFELLGDMGEWKRRLHPRTRVYDAFWLYRRRPVPVARLGYRRYARPQLRRVAMKLDLRRPRYWRAVA